MKHCTIDSSLMMKTTNSVDIIDGIQPLEHPALIVSDTIRKCCLHLG